MTRASTRTSAPRRSATIWRRHAWLCLALGATLSAACSTDGLSSDGAVPDLAMEAHSQDLAPAPDLHLDLCTDGMVDNGETDVDCGGATCGRCSDGLHCLISGDCSDGNCQAGVCLPANHCADGVRDDAETDVDCGGPVCAYCRPGRTCRGDADCAAATICDAGTCAGRLFLHLAWKDPLVYDTGAYPLAVAAGDLDRDGHVDLLVQNDHDSTVGAYLGRGDGTFSKARFSSAGSKPFNLLLADFDGDGQLDFVVGGGQTTGVFFAAGKGDGTFGAGVTSLVNDAYGPWDVGDLDGDGLPDIAGGGGSLVEVLLNQGQGAFKQGAVLQTPRIACAPSSATIADLDRDGRPDVVAVCGRDLAFAHATGQAAFAAPQALQATKSAQFVAVHDFDRDGHPDLITDGADLFRGGAKLTFAAPVGFDVGASSALAVADLDRDGHADLVLGPSNGGTLAIARGLAGPSFAAPTYVATAAASMLSLAVADFNGDGKPDVAFVDYIGDKLYVLLNDSQ